MAELDDCCSEPTNPKRDLFSKRVGSVDHLFRLNNPIPDEVIDSGELKDIFRNYNLVPYSGTSGASAQSLLVWYLMLANLSTTQAAVISKKIKYAVGGKAKVIRSVDPEFDTGIDQEDVSPEEATIYIEALKEFFDFDGGVRKFHQSVAWQFESNGNAFVEMSVASAMDQTRISLKSRKTTNCLYLNTKPGKPRVVAISPVWTDEYLKKNPPRQIPIYPLFVEQDGVKKTMFHLKHGNNSWYGRPPSAGSSLFMYREVQDAIYQVRISASNFTGQLIIEVEDDNPQFDEATGNKDSSIAGYDGFVGQFEANFTNKSDDPQSAVIASRPFGSAPMFVFQVSPNTKQEWFRVTGEINSQNILRGHGLTPRFMGFDVSNGFSSDVYISDYLLNAEPTIADLRDEITNFTNQIITAGWMLLGKTEQNLFSLTFTPPIQSSIDEFKKIKSGKPDNSGANDVPQDPEVKDPNDPENND